MSVNTKTKNETQSSTPKKTRHVALIVAGGFVVLSGLAWIGLVSFGNAWWETVSTFVGASTSEPSLTESKSTEDAVPELVPRLLDGALVDLAKAAHWPVAIMIENLPTVRPQAGLTDASVVYEALAEGGSTRFMALYDPQEMKTAKIGPVRSSRAYYLEWLGEYDALYGHAGGSPEALTVIREVGVKNLEALSGDGKYFWRDTSQFAPHNLYTSGEKLLFALRDKSLLDKQAAYATWNFTDDTALDSRGNDGTKLTFNFSTGLSYKVTWQYRRQTNDYIRFNADREHTDANTGAQLVGKNVIVQLVPEPTIEGGKGRLEMFVGGTGQAWIAQNGTLTNGTWKKDSRTDRTRFYDANGNEMSMVRGSTWIHVVPKDRPVTYE
ncbi:MAG: DUF3048 domain-containing protein [Patescibacteria group bacterium]